MGPVKRGKKKDGEYNEGMKNDKYLILVNKTHPMDEKYLESIELLPAENAEKEIITAEKHTLEAFLKLKKDMEEKGLRINIVSGYRSREEQESLLQELEEENGREYAETYGALPGYSEHETGLAIDVEYDLLFGDLVMSYNPVFAEYGFIQRYPEGKEHVTGYPPEGWHLRYVGKEHAETIEKRKVTLEEYLEERAENCTFLE